MTVNSKRITIITNTGIDWDMFLEIRSWCIDNFGPESANTIPGWGTFYAENYSKSNGFPVFRFWQTPQDMLSFWLTWGDKFELI